MGIAATSRMPKTNASELDLLLGDEAGSASRYDAKEKALVLSVGEIQAPNEEPTTHGFSWRTLWVYAGPGWLMSVAYVDPGNLESDLQAGAYAGYQLTWVLFGATVMGLFLQVLAARLGVVTGKNLAEMCTCVYPRWASVTLWIMTEIAIVASDVQEVLGSSIAFQVLFGFPLWIGCLITGFDTFTFLLLHRYGIRKLEAFFVSLILVMLVCFCANLVRGEVASVDILGGFVPRVDRYAVTQAVGILGAVIMPHNIFLHSALVQTRQVNRHDGRNVREANKYFAIESTLALFVSFLINLAVLAVFAKGFFSSDCTASYETNGINTACVPTAIVDGVTYGSCQLASGGTGMCQEIGLSRAGVALSGMLGEYADTIWAIGLLAAGQSATMTGTYAGQFVMEGFLQLHLSPWKRVALTRCVSLVPAMTVAILSQRNPADSDHMDELLNVLQSIQLPFALLPVLTFTSSPAIMGDFANSKATILTGWLMGGVVCVTYLYLLFTNLEGLDFGPLGLLMLTCIGCMYFGFLGYLVRADTTLSTLRTSTCKTLT
ncbi:metal ion (mn2-iron) transporter family [Plasmopara halstedii]|uniref:Metal ion (Mn2-iron) transporter family n=1 Tax=Plasmopara halstedii TaxID=4781 RepID=A0A0P1AMN1_PLAHL|nr:metal ion (mn2-iron) transporter family [Plasmopara halstedii]CEG42329.1 metal ion (mn2-iron) transporter family [Plasmopara halstedii]|eukprot:XP_024578698.1 metal ion (mn2-iron) transporter family [Plasmopara halstedii]